MLYDPEATERIIRAALDELSLEELKELQTRCIQISPQGGTPRLELAKMVAELAASSPARGAVIRTVAAVLRCWRGRGECVVIPLRPSV